MEGSEDPGDLGESRQAVNHRQLCRRRPRGISHRRRDVVAWRNSEGIVRFTSIYPGWYVSRTVHIHVKVHINRDTVLTTQLFFDDTLNDTINAEVSPYNEHTERDTYNKTDTIYSDEGLMQAHYDGEKVIAAINIGI